ncbi:MAG: transposase [Candidatus Parabeggiatoa sp.]|nr:transposase [Candidatus Parabeggiatoa sp.]
MKKAKKVTRIAYSVDLNRAKYEALTEIAKQCGLVRTEVWHDYGSVSGLDAKFRPVRDGWIAKQHINNLPQRIWRATLSDVLGDIKANREAAKVNVKSHIFRNIKDEHKRKNLFKNLKNDAAMVNNSYGRSLMRKYWKHGKNHTFNQIVLEPGSYKCFSYHGKHYIEVISLTRGSRIAIPIGTNYSITGQIRLILREGQVEIHYTIDNTDARACGLPFTKIGIDKGYTEAFADSDGIFHGEGLGKILSPETDSLNKKYQKRNKMGAVLEKLKEKNPKKAKRIIKHNLGRQKLDRRKKKHQGKVKTLIFTAANNIIGKAETVVCEDLTKTFKSKNLGKKTNRRLSGWVKGLMASAIDIVASRRGSRIVLVNAAYTSQICSQCGCLGKRTFDKFHCTEGCGVGMQADLNAAINILARLDDEELHRWLPFTKVKQILLKRCRRPDETAHPELQLQLV